MAGRSVHRLGRGKRKAGCEACAGGIDRNLAPNVSAGPGAGAVGVDPAIKAANLRQLRRIEGQVRGIAAMIEEDRYCADVMHQVAAVRESLRTVAKNLMRNHLTHCAAAALASDEKKRERMIEELVELAGKLSD